MLDLLFDFQTITRKLKQYGNFKTPGIDKIPNFWLKKFDSLHPHLATSFSNLVSSQEELPEWLTQGNTSLLPKSPETQRANKYRPICCLNTTYKLLTGIIVDDIYEYFDKSDFLEKEQRAA